MASDFKLILERHKKPGIVRLWWKAEIAGKLYGQYIDLKLAKAPKECNDLKAFRAMDDYKLFFKVIEQAKTDTFEAMHKPIKKKAR